MRLVEGINKIKVIADNEKVENCTREKIILCVQTTQQNKPFSLKLQSGKPQIICLT